MPPQTFADPRLDTAQQQLAVLREAIKSRLATLEEVLADPSRGESLAGLILDLSRIATEEAEATASQACLAVRVEAEREIAELRMSAKAALEGAQSALRTAHASVEQERAIGMDLRRAAEQAHLEIQKQAELLEAREQLEASLKSAREHLEAEVARQEAIVVDLRRSAADSQRHLETERAAARKAADEVAAELNVGRETLAGRERALADLQLQLDGERASAVGVRQALERAEVRIAFLERERELSQAAHEAAVADLARQAVAERERSAVELLAQLDAERTSAAELRRAASRATERTVEIGAQLQAEVTRHDTIAADLRRAAADAERQLEGERAVAREASDVAAAELALEREALAERERALADLQSQLEAERASAAEIRRRVERTAEIEAALGAEIARHNAMAVDFRRAAADAERQLEADLDVARKAADEVAAELNLEREAQVGRERALVDLQWQLDSERASGASARGALERAEARVAVLEQDSQVARSAHEAVVADLIREVAGRERAAAELLAQLEAERAASAELRRAAERAAELEAALGRETSEGRAAQDELSSEVANQREATALLKRALADGEQALAAAYAELQVERTSNADLRRAVERVDQQLSTARSSETQAIANQEQLMAQLDRLRAEAASAALAATAVEDAGEDIRRELALARTDADALRAKTDALRTETEGLRVELEAARTRLDLLATERDAVAGELRAARRWIDELREAEAEFAAPFSFAQTPALSTPSSPDPSPVDEATADDWQPVRIATRYLFNEEITVQVNGDPSRLLDLSISGCQLLCLTALKPNHAVKVMLPTPYNPVVCTGNVVWTRLELPAVGQALRYRAGVRFTKADELAIETFAAHHAATA